jgi:hypothetical protein
MRDKISSVKVQNKILVAGIITTSKWLSKITAKNFTRLDAKR